MIRGFGIEKNEKGFVMLMVMGFVLLMSMSIVSFSSMIKSDIELVGRCKTGEQAKNLAEAGIYHAFVMLKAQGIGSREDFSGTMDTGTYSVTYNKVGSRILVTSVGTVTGTGVSKSVSAEIKGSIPPVLTKMFAGGAGIKARATRADSSITVVGDIHANGDVELRSLNNGLVWIEGLEYDAEAEEPQDLSGTVAAVGIVREGAQHDAADENDAEVYINGIGSDGGSVSEGARRIAFPVFDYLVYKQQAIASGNYYSGNTTFNNATLTPGKGVVYVDGKATIKGTTTLNGGIVADEIDIQGTLNQTAHAGGISPTRNFILAKNSEIGIFGGLNVDEALVYAKTGIRTRSSGVQVNINGIVLAETGEMSFWDVKTNVVYEYVLTYPSDLSLDFDFYDDDEASPDEGLAIVNWTK